MALNKFTASILALFVFLLLPAEARFPRGTSSGFNGGKSQVNLEATEIGADYPFLNMQFNAGAIGLLDNLGTPSPADLDSNNYPLPGSNAITAHGGVFSVFTIPRASNAGTIYAARVTGKGTVFGYGTVQTINAASVTPGSNTALVFSSAPEFTAGMEVPISGTTGTLAVTNASNTGTLPNGGATGAFTVCTGYVAGALTVPLCLNDQVTPVTTTGTATGTTTASYGRKAVGVATNGRIVMDLNVGSGGQEAGDSISVTAAITAQDASTPITKIAVVRIGSEETRYLAGEIFGADYLAKLQQANFGVIRHLNTLNTNISNVVNWADRTPLGAWSYGTYQLKNSIYAGAATGAGLDYAGTLGSLTLVDKRQITTSFPRQSATISVASPSVISSTGHGLQIGDVFNIFYDATAPTGITPFTGGQTVNYYVISSGFTANSFQYALTQGGTAINVTGAGSGSFYIQKTTVDVNVTFSGSTITWAQNHMLSVNDPIACGARSGSTLPTNINGVGGIYYVKTTPTATTMTIAATPGGTAITFTGSPSGSNFCIRLPTYNLNGTGAKPILASNADALSYTGNSIPRSKTFGKNFAYGTLTYDEIMGAWLLFGSTDGWQTMGLGSYWPPEIAFALALKTRSHPQFPSPAYANNGATVGDYMPSLAYYLYTNQPSWMIPRIDIKNEQWNGQFNGSFRDIALGQKLTFDGTWSTGGSTYEMGGREASLLGQALQQIYGGTVGGTGSKKYETHINVQTGIYTSSGAADSTDSKLTAAQFVAQATSAPASVSVSGFGAVTFAKQAAYKTVTHVDPANYMRSAPGAAETALAATFDGKVFTASISGTTLAVTSTQLGALASGDVIFGNGVPGSAGTVTISGSAPNWTLSQNLGTQPSRTLYAGTSWTPVRDYVDLLAGSADSFNLAQLVILYGVVSNWAKQSKFNADGGAVKKMAGYEGGYSPDYDTRGGVFNTIDALRHAGKFATSSTLYPTGLQGILKQNYDSFISAGGEFPSMFTMTGAYPSNNVWSVREDLYQTGQSPQWDAAIQFNQ